MRTAARGGERQYHGHSHHQELDHSGFPSVGKLSEAAKNTTTNTNTVAALIAMTNIESMKAVKIVVVQKAKKLLVSEKACMGQQAQQ